MISKVKNRGPSVHRKRGAIRAKLSGDDPYHDPERRRIRQLLKSLADVRACLTPRTSHLSPGVTSHLRPRTSHLG